ncbi:hypothetical protein Ga0609869_003250 [Rhodovulum iodosum]|uniref:DUF3047 domain-containing protein n=1 Tax=Rhodovulum iodosum TaxID=68291 RepID=A0ABV3XZU9_9RHOB|nr:DUF3047 domain-containing protein [Rhodovulum robiginosum]RSK34070.1 DUF3047 domain-containing protein [Rhodovulum robiginosum]
MRKLMTALVCLLATAPGMAEAGQIAFAEGWKEQRFSLLSSNDYALDGDSLGVRSDGTVSLLWTALPRDMWQGRRASWEWAVERSVPATDLTRRGGDDRNLSLYFLFLPEAAALEARGKGVRALLDNPQARVLMYVWGGAHPRGQVLPSPYLGARGRSVIQRQAGTGAAAERVDLRRDHRRAFGEPPQSLVGVAVSSDSDDTGTRVLARIADLRVE